MTLTTSENEITAVQGLLALRGDPNRVPSGVENKKSGSDPFSWNSPLSHQSSSCNSFSYISPSFAYTTSPMESDDCLVQEMSTMTTNENISPTTLFLPDNKTLLIINNNETQFIKRSQDQERQFQEFHQQAYLAHQAQLVRQSQEPRYTQFNQQQQQRTLPSIQEMMAHPQHPLLSRNSPTRASIPYHPYRHKRTHPTSDNSSLIPEARRQRLDHHQQQERQSVENQQKQKHMPRHSQQLLELKVLLQSQQNHRILASLRNRTDAELQSFLQCLRQFYRDEYDKELKQKKLQQQPDTTTSEEDEDEDDGDSDYQPPIASGSSNTATTTSLMTNKKNTSSTKKRLNGGADKPRWTTQEKYELFEAIVRHKSLDIMSTFDWVSIGLEVGRLDKACKDQWRRGILKMFREYIINSNII